MVLRRARKNRPAKRRPNMKRRGFKPKRGARAVRSSDYAKLVEIKESKLTAACDPAGESQGSILNFCLQDYQRAQEVAHAYKWYRAAKVEVVFIPYFNVAQTGGVGNTQLPQLYMAVDRLSNRYIAPSETECLERGITPRLFNKKLRLMFKPNLLQEISLETRQPADGGGVPQGIDLAGFQNATAVFNKWLPTQQSFGYNATMPITQTGQVIAPNGVNPYALTYHGVIYNAAVEGQAPGTQFYCGDYQVKITWEFKGPRALKTNPPGAEPNPYVGTSSQGNPGAAPNTQPTTYP